MATAKTKKGKTCPNCGSSLWVISGKTEKWRCVNCKRPLTSMKDRMESK